MTPSWTNAHQLKNHAALKRKRTEVIKDPCIAAAGFTYEEDAMKGSDEKNWISRDLSWNKYPEFYGICIVSPMNVLTSVMITSFILTILAEWGDQSQIATIAGFPGPEFAITNRVSRVISAFMVG
ncbi:hypothetical protein Tco_0987766 [Tanacetum coccineum]